MPNGANGQRCKVVVDVTLKIVEDEDEDEKQERARDKVSRQMGNNYGSCSGKVVNADDGEQLGEYVTYVHGVKRDAVNLKLYVEKKYVLRALARTQNGTRRPPKKDHGPFYPDQKCNFLKAARELFSEGGDDLVLKRELARFSQQEDADSDEDEEDEDEEDAEEDDDKFIYVWPNHSKLDVDFETFAKAKNEMFFRRTRVRGYGYRTMTHYGNSPEEVVEKVIYQSKVNLLSQLNMDDDELHRKLEAGAVEELEAVDIHVSPEKLKSMVAHVRMARKGMPSDADENDPNWKYKRWESVSCAAMGVSVKRVDGVLKYVVNKDTTYKYAHTEAGHAEALNKALELSPSLRRLYEDAVRAQDLLSVVQKRRKAAAAAAAARRSGGPMKDIFRTWMADINETLQGKGIHIDLVAVGVEITSEASDAIDARL